MRDGAMWRHCYKYGKGDAIVCLHDAISLQ